MRMHIICSFVYILILFCFFSFFWFFIRVFVFFLFCFLNTNYDTYNAQESRKTNLSIKSYQKFGARYPSGGGIEPLANVFFKNSSKRTKGPPPIPSVFCIRG